VSDLTSPSGRPHPFAASQLHGAEAVGSDDHRHMREGTHITAHRRDSPTSSIPVAALRA